MIRAMIFDLDGTLVQTERLKALSYARAAVELCPHGILESDVMEAFKAVVGLSRREVAATLVERFHLTEKAHERMAEFGVDTAWQAYVQVRLQIYTQMLADPDVIRKNQWPHNVSLLHEAHKAGCKVGLATMSFCQQVRRVLEILGMTETFEFVATRDDVDHGKPDPEIYLLVANELGVQPLECVVIEDSSTGVKAALNAGMSVIAVSTPFTQKRLHKSALLPDTHIVDDPGKLPDTVAHVIKEME
jgi:beta-phosphoglucomutase